MASSTLLLTQEEKTQVVRNIPILIIDKNGIIGSGLYKELYKECPIVYVSQAPPQEWHASNPAETTFIPFRKTIPTLPNYKYSHVFIVQDDSYSLQKILAEIVKKAKHDKTKLLSITTLPYLNIQMASQLHEYYKNAHSVVIGDLFDTKKAFYSDTPLAYMVRSVLQAGRIELMGSGMRHSYPVYYEDAINHILRIGFDNSTAHYLLYILPPHPPTDLMLAHMIQKDNPSLRVDFSPEAKPLDIQIPQLPFDGVFVLEAEYNPSNKIKKLFGTYKNDEGQKPHQLVHRKIVPAKKSSLPFALLFLIYFLLCTIVVPVFITFVFASLGGWRLKGAVDALKIGRVKESYTASSASGFLFSLATFSSNVVLFESGVIGFEKPVGNILRLVYTGKNVSSAFSETLAALLTLKNIGEGSSARPEEDFVQASGKFYSSLELLGKMQADPWFKKLSPQIAEEFTSFDPIMRLVTVCRDIAPQLLAFDRPKNYLILFQNNKELRPGGGFIGSYGIVSLKKGKILDFKIHDVYEADGQLKGHIEPSFAIRRYMPNVHLFLRDSNFFIDSRNNASQSARMLKAETGQTVDGVITVDTTFVKGVIEAVGFVDVPLYKQRVTAQNFYEITQSRAEKDFFPGSTQKKDFLTELFSALQQKLLSGKGVSYKKLLLAFSNALAQKHVTLVFAEPQIENVFLANGYSSSLWDSRVDTGSTINDFLAVIDANIGVNKANYFVDRMVKQDMHIDEQGGIVGSATVQYINNSKQGKWPGGDYKNYVRFVLPKGSDLKQVLIDGVLQKTVDAVTEPALYEKKGYIPPKELEIEKNEEEGKTWYGFLLIVPAGQKKIATIIYGLDQKIALSEPTFYYTLWRFKQPGTEEDPYYFSLTYPQDFRLLSTKKINAGEEVLNSENSFKLTASLVGDMQLVAQFSHK